MQLPDLLWLMVSWRTVVLGLCIISCPPYFYCWHSTAGTTFHMVMLSIYIWQSVQPMHCIFILFAFEQILLLQIFVSLASPNTTRENSTLWFLSCLSPFFPNTTLKQFIPPILSCGLNFLVFSLFYRLLQQPTSVSIAVIPAYFNAVKLLI